MNLMNLLALCRILLALQLVTTSCKASDEFEFRISFIHGLIKNHNWTCTDVVDMFVKRAYTYNTKLNSIINMNGDVFGEALQLDNYYKEHGKFRGLLHCIPFAIKDNIDVAGLPTTGGIKALRRSIPQKDALVIEKLRSQGALFLFKANLHELAYLPNMDLPICRNPFDLNRLCGGSSSGSAAAISSGQAVVGLGTDTIGSILTPSSFNGLYGLRPPQGVPKMEGIFPLFERHDTVGPMTKYLDDLVLTFCVMADSPLYKYEDYLRPIENATIRLGFSRILMGNFNFTVANSSQSLFYFMDPQVERVVHTAVQNFNNLNFQLVEIDLDEHELSRTFTSIQYILEIDLHDCLNSCKRDLINEYFNDSERFPIDSPYRNAQALYDSPLLSETWQYIFNDLNNETSDQNCRQNCVGYDTFLLNFKRLIARFYQVNQLDGFLMPSRLQPPHYANKTHPDNLLDSLDIFCSFSGYPCLNIPIGFCHETDQRASHLEDGLPVGLILMSQPENLMKTLKFVRLYEKTYGLVKLPHTVPLLTDNRCNYHAASISLTTSPTRIASILVIFIFMYFDS
jgi:Asp-tRNA(Asn)/Glu-tRNA(Gln) amidotransferase A subunit family amidase